MKRTTESFSQILEQYVFEVASQYISSAEPVTQTELINLLTRVSQSEDDPASVKGLTRDEPSEWKQVLEEPIDWYLVHRQWLFDINRSWLARNRQYVVRLEAVIATTRQRWQQLQVSPLSEPCRLQLMTYYEQTLARYEQQLTQVLSHCTAP